MANLYLSTQVGSLNGGYLKAYPDKRMYVIVSLGIQIFIPAYAFIARLVVNKETKQFLAVIDIIQLIATTIFAFLEGYRYNNGQFNDGTIINLQDITYGMAIPKDNDNLRLILEECVPTNAGQQTRCLFYDTTLLPFLFLVQVQHLFYVLFLFLYHTLAQVLMGGCLTSHAQRRIFLKEFMWLYLKWFSFAWTETIAKELENRNFASQKHHRQQKKEK